MAKAPAKSEDICAAIRSQTPPRHGGNDPWYLAVPREVLEKLEALHDEQLAGTLSGSATWLARRMSHELRTRRISNVGYQGVLAWMKERQRVPKA